jgi:hypothetical protein
VKILNIVILSAGFSTPFAVRGGDARMSAPHGFFFYRAEA